VAVGTPEEIEKNPQSVTGAYLSGEKAIQIPKHRRPMSQRSLLLKGVRTHNLRNLNVSFPLGVLTCVTGVSGSGKSSLIVDTLLPALKHRLHGARQPDADFDAIEGLAHVDKVIDIYQAPIGRTPRSNPATFTGLFTHIRDLFANLPESKARGYKAGRYSFNIKGGRCEACQGDGILRIEMHFLPDVYVECEACGGRRYSRETLEVKYRQASIADVLAMTVSQACDFLQNIPKLQQKLETLREVGLGYIKLGQSATTLSGGDEAAAPTEAQPHDRATTLKSRLACVEALAAMRQRNPGDEVDKSILQEPRRWLAIGALISLTLACSDKGVSPLEETDSELPRFESSAAELQQTYDTVTADADQKLSVLAGLANGDPQKLDFANTIQAYEEILDEVTVAANRASLFKDVHPNADIMAKATELNEDYNAWFNASTNNGGVYRTLLAYAKKAPPLVADEQKLMADTLNSFKRNGITEEGVVNPDVLRLQNEIAALQTQLDQTVLEANARKNTFTADELEGLSADQLAALTKEGENYLVLSGDDGTLGNVVRSFATKEATRKRAKVITNARALDNIGLITTLVQKRLELAKVLGFSTWADYKTQTAMAKTGAIASGFVDTVSSLLKPKLTLELAALSSFLQPGINDDNGQIDSWDVAYFDRLYEKQLAVDYEGLSKYFPYDQVVRGMFDVYETIFGLKIDFVPTPAVWHPDVQLAKVSERSGNDTGPTIGYVYFDNFPRIELGKFNHFETTSLILGKDLDHNKYRKPVAALVCNFPVNADGTPANLLFSDIDALLHEFGHALHVVLGKARFASQSGFSTPRDFVEVPSTMSEQWRFDSTVFKMMATSDPAITDQFVQQTIAAMKAANLATTGLSYEGQFGLSKADFVLHSFTDAAQIPAADSPNNLTAMANQAMTIAYLPFPEGSGFLNSFQHILTWGYDAGYYSYAWSDSIVAELADVFEDPSNTLGYMNSALGLKYRTEILAPGNSREVASSVEAFTGHPLDAEHKAFLRRLGVQ
jgi:Zn-dependent oligopeptidase